MKALRIFWIYCSMSDDVAKKGSMIGGKQYKKEQKQTDFPMTVQLEEASSQIYTKYGKRPEGNIYVGHSFAVITTYTTCEVEEITGDI